MSHVRFAILSGCAALLCLAQTQPPVIRSDVHVVQVSVIVTGANGLPVSGLKASDFRIFDNGKEQTIATLEELDSRAAPGQPELPPNTYSNRLPEAGQPGKAARPRVLSAIFLDNVNTKSRFQTAGRRAVESILNQLDPAECVAIYALGSRFQVIHDFSSDRTSLLARLKAFHGEAPEGNDLLAEQDLDIGIARLDKDPVEKAIFDTARAVDTFEALEAIANYMQGIPGRKNLLWISEAFSMEVGDSQRLVAPSPLNPVNYIPYRNFGPEMKRAMQALNNADVSVYPIGAHGLSKGPTLQMMNPDPHLLTRLRDQDSVASGVHTMNNVAAETGGKAFADSNDLAQGVRKALDDSRIVYWMTYYPRSFVADGSYHRINVRTVRPGVQLRFRQGYFSTGTPEDGGAGVEARVTRALSSPLDASEIGLRASAGLGSGGAGELAVAIDVDAADLALTRTGDRWTGEMTMVAVQIGAAGERYEAIRQTANLNLTEETYRRVLTQGLRLNMKLKREAAAVAVRIGVGDQRSTHVGSLSVPLLN